MVSMFNAMPTSVGYLMLQSSLKNNGNGTIFMHTHFHIYVYFSTLVIEVSGLWSDIMNIIIIIIIINVIVVVVVLKIIILYLHYTSSVFSSPAQTDGLSLESEEQQVALSLKDSLISKSSSP